MSRVLSEFELLASAVQRALTRHSEAAESVAAAEAHLATERDHLATRQAELEQARTDLFESYPELLPPQTPTPAGSSSDSEWRPPGGALDFGEQDDSLPPDLEFRET